MVRKGNITVELVEAKTKKKFQEHIAKMGKIYAEVEPDIDYFVCVKNDTSRFLSFEVSIDDQYLGYSLDVYENTPYYLGLRSKNEQSKTIRTALRFKKLPLDSNMNKEKDFEELVGKVKVIVYDIQVERKRKVKKKVCKSKIKKEFQSPWKDPGNVKTVKSKITQEKCVQSKRGEIKEDDSDCDDDNDNDNDVNDSDDGYSYFKKTKLIKRICIHYCTARGLIYAGILPPPSKTLRTDQNQLTRKVIKRRYRVNIEPKIIYEGICNTDGKMNNRKVVEEFDLTYATDSD